MTGYAFMGAAHSAAWRTVARVFDVPPSFADGLQVQRVLDAVRRSAAAGSGWTRAGPPGPDAA